MSVQLTQKQAHSITEVVAKVMENGYPSDKVLNYLFRDNHITDEYDKSIIAEVSYEILRWWRLLLEVYNNYPVTRDVDYWKLLGTWLVLNNWKLPQIAQFRSIDEKYIKTQYESFSSFRKIRQSIPDVLDQHGFIAYGDTWEDELTALNKVPPIFLRTNRLKIKPNELSQKLKTEGFDNRLVEKAPDAIMLTARSNIFQSKYFQDGFFEVQDAGSQSIASFLEVKPGMRVIDACAGNGGKTLHLASLMQNKGKIIALDTNDKRLQTLKKRAARAGVDIIETRLIENSKLVKRIHESADRLLLDVPCSGSGAIRRNPEIKWRINDDRLKTLMKIQSDLLTRYSSMLKPGGILVYATCSILPVENQKQVELFIEKNKGKYELVKELYISPASTGFDGFYMAQIHKISN